MALQIDRRDLGGITILDLTGKVVRGEEVRALNELVKRLVAEQQSKIVLNLEKVSYVDSTGVGTLVHCFTAAKAAGGGLRLAKPDERFREVLKLTNLLGVLDIYANEEEAIASFGLR